MTTPSGTTELKKYKYRYETPKGTVVSGIIHAEDEIDAGINLDFIALKDPDLGSGEEWVQVMTNARISEVQSTEDQALLKDFNGTMLILFLMGFCMVLYAALRYLLAVYGRADGM